VNPSRFIAALLFVIISSKGSASQRGSQDSFARVSLIRLSQAMKFKVSHQGLVVVPIEDCSVFMNGRSVAFKRGDYKEFHSGDHVELSPAVSTHPQLVLVDVIESSQPLTILAENLAVHQELEDASDRNQTLMIALDTFQINDERDLASEGEPWKSSPTKPVELHPGQVTWLDHGMHHLRNAGNTVARFVTVEW